MVTAQPQQLSEVEAAVWRELAAATRDPGHGWHVAMLATWDGHRADARSVVLREVDVAARTLLIYTDVRSAKVRQLELHPHATLLAWSAPLGWQLRLRVRLSVQTAGLAVSSRWARLEMSPAEHDYLSPLPADPRAPSGRGRCPPPQRAARENFAVIEACIEDFDWLELGAQQRRHARFDAQGGRWLKA